MTITSPDTEIVSEPLASPAPRRDSTPRVVLQFFLGPLLIVIVCAAIYYLFGLVVFEKRTPADFLREIRSGSSSERWQAAFELSRWIASGPDAVKDPAFSRELVGVFRQSRHEDPRVRRYLALALGRLGDPSGVEPLVEALDDPDPETRLYAAWSLGALRDAAAVPPLVALLGSDDAGMVKMSAYALGAIGDRGAAPALQPLLASPAAEVRWNAALALARLDDRSAVPVLIGMTDAEELARVDGLTEPQKVEAMTNAVRALGRLGDERGAERIRALRASAPFIEVREAAASVEDAAR
jgi:HEAT repeat protein